MKCERVDKNDIAKRGIVRARERVRKKNWTTKKKKPVETNGKVNNCLKYRKRERVRRSKKNRQSTIRYFIPYCTSYIINSYVCSCVCILFFFISALFLLADRSGNNFVLLFRVGTA